MKRYPENDCIGNPVSWESSKLTRSFHLCQCQIVTKLNQQFCTFPVSTISFDNIANPNFISYCAYFESLNKCLIILPIHRGIYIFPQLLIIKSWKVLMLAFTQAINQPKYPTNRMAMAF